MYHHSDLLSTLLVPVTHFEEKNHYSLPDGKSYTFARLGEQCGETVSHTILTTEPNAQVQSLQHHRMPVLLLTESDRELWLNPDIDSREPLKPLFEPTRDGLLVVEAR